MAMFYRNSQGNIINLDNVREIVQRGKVIAYDLQAESFKYLQSLDSTEEAAKFMDWLWERIDKRFGTESPYCSYEEFASLQAVKK